MAKASLVPLTLPSDPTSALHAATKQYVDGHTHTEYSATGHNHDAAYSASGHSHGEFPDLVEASLTSNITVAAPVTGTTNRNVARFAYFANGVSVDVSFSTSVRISTGVTRGPYNVPAGEVLLAAMEYSTLINAWVLTAVTVSAV